MRQQLAIDGALLLSGIVESDLDALQSTIDNYGLHIQLKSLKNNSIGLIISLGARNIPWLNM